MKTENTAGRQIHVMHVVSSFGCGGAEAGVVKMIQGFGGAKLRHSVVSMTPDIALASRLPEHTLCHVLQGGARDRTAFFKLRSLFIREKVDIAHGNNLGPWFDVALGARLAGCKSILTFHGVENPDMGLSLPRKIQAGICACLGDRITAVSGAASQLFSSLTNIPESRVVVIPNGIDAQVYSPVSGANLDALKNRLNLPADRKLIGCVAGLRAVKNHTGLISAFAELKRRGRRAALILTGEGPLRQALYDQVKQLNLVDDVRFTGNIECVPDLLKCLDIFVLNSKTEGLSYALLEAMATGLPIVATRVGGNPALIEDGVNGLLVDEGNQTQLISALEGILDDRNMRQDMGEESRVKIESGYTMPRVLDRYLKLYNDLVPYDTISLLC